MRAVTHWAAINTCGRKKEWKEGRKRRREGREGGREGKREGRKEERKTIG